MHRNADLLTRFYTSLQRRDADGMADCYGPDAVFSDPVFPALSGGEVGRMWRMLCERGTDLRIEFGDVAADEQVGHVHWEAWYTFSRSGRPVHNVIDAYFEFRDGKIVRHADQFDFAKWAAQAIGPIGRVPGLSFLLKLRVQSTAARQLRAFSSAADSSQ